MPRIHNVSQGETLISIAIRYGYRSWEKIWECPENAELRQQRGNPHVLWPGDLVFVPDPRERVEKCVTGKVHRFVLRKPRAHFRVLLDIEGTPFVGHRYRLAVAEETFEGLTGARGLVEHEIDPHATQATLTLWLDREQPSDEHVHVWHLKLGYLDPPDKVSGAQAVLHNLGYYDGEISGAFDDETRQALIDFQRDHDVPEPHGGLDEATWSLLRDAHEIET